MMSYFSVTKSKVYLYFKQITVENFGATEVKELIPNGADTPVVKQNR